MNDISPITRRTPKPDFKSLPDDLIDYAWKCWREGDVTGIMWLSGHENRGELLMDNLHAFRSRGMYEIALVECYTHGPHLPPRMWQCLFSLADRTRLLSLSEPIPSDAITVYRGVSNRKHRRWIRNMSWTTNPNTAAWFATRFASAEHDPAVYSLRVNPEHILHITNERAEEEVVVDVWKCGRMKQMSKIPESVKPTSKI